MIYGREMNSDNCYLHVAKIISFLVGFCGARTMTERFYAIESACKSIFQFYGFKVLCKYLHISAISAALIDGVLIIQQQIYPSLRFRWQRGMI